MVIPPVGKTWRALLRWACQSPVRSWCSSVSGLTHARLRADEYILLWNTPERLRARSVALEGFQPRAGDRCKRPRQRRRAIVAKQWRSKERKINPFSRCRIPPDQNGPEALTLSEGNTRFSYAVRRFPPYYARNCRTGAGSGCADRIYLMRTPAMILDQRNPKLYRAILSANRRSSPMITRAKPYH